MALLCLCYGSRTLLPSSGFALHTLPKLCSLRLGIVEPLVPDLCGSVNDNWVERWMEKEMNGRMLMQILPLCFKARSALHLCIWWLWLEGRRGTRWSINRELCKSPLARTLVLNRFLIISLHIHFVVHFCCVGARIHVREGERNNYSSTVAILEMLHICTVWTMPTSVLGLNSNCGCCHWEARFSILFTLIKVNLCGHIQSVVTNGLYRPGVCF